MSSQRTTDDDLTPEAASRRKKFWIKWTGINLLLILVVTPAVFMLLGDVIVKLFNGDDSTRVQAGIGIYLLAAASGFCTLLPVNIIALIFALLARSERNARRNGTSRPVSDDDITPHQEPDDGYHGYGRYRRGPHGW
ncbi:MAG TPA: hypothetical protein VJM32_04585 [Candidatus Saccharimonadales bacterium]|nr:hypothetical protein [Candidatus Saccharimonadales bacterium]